MSVVVGTAVNAEGKREIVGLDVGTSEDGAFWLSFLRSLVARGLTGVELVISDAHQGLRDAIATVFAGASWQRCSHALYDQSADSDPRQPFLPVAPVDFAALTPCLTDDFALHGCDNAVVDASTIFTARQLPLPVRQPLRLPTLRRVGPVAGQIELQDD